MALGNGNNESFKKNGKFESFLKRTISEEAFERIRAYESCIVVSEKENKSFKFVVLSDEKIFLTENPPKTLQEVVHLKDVTSVELVNEFPDFLSGQERSNTQQIAISYTITESLRRRSLRKSKRSPRNSLTDINGADRSNASTPLGYSSSADSGMDELMTSASFSSTSLVQSRPTSRGSIKGLQTKKKKKNNTLNDSLDHESILRSLKEEIEEDMLEDIEEDRLSMMKSSVPSNADHRFKSGASVHSNGRGSGLNTHDKKSSAALQDSVSIRSSSQQSVRPLPPMPRTGAFETTAKSNKLNSSSQVKGQTAGSFDLPEVETVNEKGCCAFLRCCGGQKNQVAPICKTTQTISMNKNTSSSKPSKLNNSFTGSHLSDNPGNPPPSRGSSTRGGGSRTGTPLLDSERNINELNTSTSDLGRSASFIGLSSLPIDGLTERRKCVLNIYLLNLTSPLLMLLRSAWNNHIIKSTLALEPEQFEIPTTPAPMSTNTSEIRQRDKIERQYTQIKRDLFQTHLTMEEQLPFIEQLRSATQKNYLVKKLFWKNPDMFCFLISQLQKYLPRSSAKLTTEEGKAQRADELEFVTVILNTLNLMFRESEILPSRLQTLRLESGKSLRDFTRILICQPDIPYQPLTLTKHWSAPIAGTKMTKSEKNLDEELARLKTEYTRTAIASLFELFLVAKQAPLDDIEILSVAGMANLFEENKSMEKFVDRVLSQVMELVSLSRFDLLTPVQAMQVYQMFTLLQIFLEQNKHIVVHIRNNYYEEFKYFIQAPAVSRKLPLQFPITPITVSTIDIVVAQVLGVQTSRGGKA